MFMSILSDLERILIDNHENCQKDQFKFINFHWNIVNAFCDKPKIYESCPVQNAILCNSKGKPISSLIIQNLQALAGENMEYYVPTYIL